MFRSRIKLGYDERRFLDVLAIIALAFVGLLYLSPSSTAVDRMALYIIPIQLLVLGRLPLVFARTMAPDRQVSSIRLSDKTSRLRPRHVVPKPT